MTGRLVAAALLAAAAACTGPSRKADEANALRHAGRPREALALYREILAELGEGRLPAGEADLRLRALRSAADVSYLELGDFQGALAYYRRLAALYPGTDEAWQARATIGDIFRDRLGDRIGAIAQWAEIAAGPSPLAPRYQLQVARGYLELKNTEQARTEARILRERWPRSPEADEAQMLAGQAWALEGRPEEALRAFQALLDRGPPPALAARALEAMAHLYAQRGPLERCGRESCLDRAIELYARALPAHPNPEAVHMNVESVRRRQEAARPVRPGDRAAALDYQQPGERQREP
ncbi:MAG TPA: tetratricopeptide repeat protein [Anaeromyxobacteraceae bacterium]